MSRFTSAGVEVDFAGFDVSGLDDTAREAAIQALRDIMTPCTPRTAAEEAAKLRAGLAGKLGADDALTAVLLVDLFCEYPAEIVRDVCKRLRRSRTFVPTEGELAVALDAAMAEPRMMLEALQNPANPDDTPTEPAAIQAGEVDRILANYGIGAAEPPTPKAYNTADTTWKRGPGRSQAQMEAEGAADKAAYWRERLGIGGEDAKV